MKALFQLPEYESQWVDSYTGEIRRAAHGQNAEHQGKEFQSAASHRRVQELEGFTERPVKRPEPEEKLAEIILPQKSPSQEFMRGASKFFGGSSKAVEGSKLATLNTALPSAPMRNVPLKTESINAGSQIHSTGEGLKQSASAGIGAKIKTRDAQPKPFDTKQLQVSSHLPASYELRQGEKTYYDQASQRSVPNYTPIELEAKLNLRENSLSRDIVLDILMMKGFEPSHQTFATNELHDIATKLAVPTSAKIQHSIDFLTQALAQASDLPSDSSLLPSHTASKSTGVFQASHQGTQDLRNAAELFPDLVQNKPKRLSTDVFIALERAKSQTLKEDPVEQLRLGTWAVHVLAGRMDTPATELLRGMKKDAVLALGRLSMQLLSSSANAQTSFSVDSVRAKSPNSQTSQTIRGRTAGGKTAEALEFLEEQEAELPTATSTRKSVDTLPMERTSIRGANEFFRMEAIQSDLQALQNNISLQFTADMLVEGFIESLRNDDLDTAEVTLRSDILSQFQAHENLQTNSKKDSISVERSSMGVLGVNAQTLTQSGKEIREKELESQRPLEITGDSRVKRGVQDKKRISFFPSIEVLPNEKVEGAWVKIPESKYIE